MDNEDEEEALLAAAIEESKRTAQTGGDAPAQPEHTSSANDVLGGGVAAALAKLRENG